MSFLQRSFDFLVSSNPELGAVSKSADGSAFSIQLESKGLGIPKNSQNCTVSVVNSELWYNTPNVVAGENNELTFHYSATSVAPSVATVYTIHITPGTYNGDTISQAIYDAITVQYPAIAGDVVQNKRIVFKADRNAGKMILEFSVSGSNMLGLDIDFTRPNSIGQILGFNTVIAPTVGNIYFIGDLEPKFNSFNYYLLQSDLVTNGIRIGPQFNQIIAKVLVGDTKPNFQVIYEPNNPTLIDAQSLAGDNRRRYTFRLLDDHLKAVDTRGEYYSIQLRISYFEPVNFSLIN